MKHKLLIITFLLSLSTFAADDFKKLRFGVVASPNISWVKTNGKTVNSDNAKIGFNFGLEIDYFFADNYSFNTGLQMCYLNSALTYKSGYLLNKYTFNNTTVEYHINYLKIPIGLKFLSDNLGDFNIYVQMGLQLQFRLKTNGTTSGNKMLNGKIEADKIDSYNGDLIDHFNNNKMTDEINPLNMAYYVGGGLEYYFVGKTAFQIGVRYENGLIDIVKSKGKEDFDSTLNTLNLVVGLIF